MPPSVPTSWPLLDLGLQRSPEVGTGDVLLLVPLGSMEQHGPHLPLSTDSVVAASVTRSAAEVLVGEGRRVLVAPTLAYGSSGEHEGFPGTVSIGHEALHLLLLEFGRSAVPVGPGAGLRQRSRGQRGHPALGRRGPALRGPGRGLDLVRPDRGRRPRRAHRDLAHARARPAGRAPRRGRGRVPAPAGAAAAEAAPRRGGGRLAQRGARRPDARDERRGARPRPHAGAQPARGAAHPRRHRHRATGPPAARAVTTPAAGVDA